MMQFVDQIGQAVSLQSIPQRIVSLVPSITELLFDLGLGDRVVGVTKFCVHPADARVKKTQIGGTKNPKIPLIQSLFPDLVIANKEENRQSDIEAISSFCPVWVSDVQSIPDAFQLIQAIGTITGSDENASALLAKIHSAQNTFVPPAASQKCLYLIWRDPWMAAGTDTFIHHMLESAGYANCISETRYPMLSEKKMRALRPEVVLLSSEPYPFGEKHLPEIQRYWPTAQIKLVDGEMFSWYGSRLQYVWQYMSELQR